MQFSGFDKIPEKGPMIIIANHPSAFMDPIIIASHVKQPVHFIAAGEYIGRGFKAWVFKKFLHMIPVYRPSTRPEDVHKNKDMFNACFEHLSQGGTLMIFPEGVSVTERKIKPFKTGVARIAIGAEIMYQQKLNLKIVSIGINYQNPHHFRSDVFVKSQEPIQVTDFIKNKDTDDFSQVEELTKYLENIMHNLTLHVENEHDESMFDKLNLIYSRDLKQELGIAYKEQEREFEVQKNIIEAIHYFKENKPTSYQHVSRLIDEYIAELRKVGIHDKDIKEFNSQKKFKRYFSYFLGSPFFITGFVLNFIPYQFVQYVLNKVRFNETFQGSLIVAFGLFSFSLYYALLITAVWLITPLGFYSLLIPVLAHSTGVYALMYMDAIKYTYQRKNLRKKVNEDKKAIEQLSLKREKLIHTLFKFKEEFKEQQNQ